MELSSLVTQLYQFLVMFFFFMSSFFAGACLGTAEELELRVETEIFSNSNDTPVAHSLTLFRNDITWDFLDTVAGSKQGEIIVHDPNRERLVVLDSALKIKTELNTIRLKRLGISLAAWAQKSSNPLMKWAGQHDYTDKLEVGEAFIKLDGPRVQYDVTFTKNSNPKAVAAYRQFADTAILLKSLMRPGGIPPFPRLAINGQIEKVCGIPTEVKLSIAPKVPLTTGIQLRSTHKSHPQLIAGDISRIETASAQMSVAELIELEDFVQKRSEYYSKDFDH